MLKDGINERFCYYYSLFLPQKLQWLASQALIFFVADGEEKKYFLC
jgi:hypothetical protein